MKKYDKIEREMLNSIKCVVSARCIDGHSAYTLRKLYSFVDDDTDILTAVKKLVSYVDELYDSMLDSDDDADYSEYYLFDGYTVAQLRNAVDFRMYLHDRK